MSLPTYETVSIDFPIGKKRRQRSMQIWSALGTSDGTGGAASADNRTVGAPTGGRGTTKDYVSTFASGDSQIGSYYTHCKYL